MDYTIEPRFKQLEEKISNTEVKLNESIKNRENTILTAVASIKKDINEDIRKKVDDINIKFKQHLDIVKERENDLIQQQQVFVQQQQAFENNIDFKLDSAKSLNLQRDEALYNTIAAQNKKLENIDFYFKDTPKGDYIYYTDIHGRTTGTFIAKHQEKYSPDEVTLVSNDEGKVSVAYKFDSDDFFIDENNNIKITGLSLNGGKHLDADRLNNDLNNAIYNISSLNYKIESILKKLNSLNGYLMSNDFKRKDPSQDQLTNFAISSISSAINQEITKEKIPNGTKIKNSFDNHIWVLNYLSYDGLTTYKWEDFGSDNICLANNNGTLGLVSGSQDRYKGFVDVKGRISINGLEEDLTSIFNSIQSLSNSMMSYINSVDTQLKNMENKIKILESK